MSYFLAPTSNYVSTTLNGSINDSAVTITLNDASKLQAPGYVVIDREDGNGTPTPNSREIIYFGGISGNDLTDCTRGADNSTARSHSDGGLVEAVLTAGMWNSLATAVSASLDEGGAGLHVSNVTISSTLNSANIFATTRVGVSGASVTGRFSPPLMSASSSATISFDIALTNKWETILAGGNKTIAWTNAPVGYPFLIRLIQDGTGSRLATWWGNSEATVKWAGGTAPTLTTTANKADTFGLEKANASIYYGYVVGANQ
jgi:hypothetical protein